MRRTILTAALALAAAGLFATPASAGGRDHEKNEPEPEACSHWSYTPKGHAVEGDRWRASFHVERPCTVELWSFKASGPSWPHNSPQTLFAHVTHRLDKGDHSKSIELPPCYFQADVTVNGRVVDTETGGKTQCPPPSTTTTSPPPSTTTTSSTPPTSTTTSTPATTTSTPTTAPAPSDEPSPPSSITSSSPPVCVEGSTTSGDGSPTDTACEQLAFSGSNPILGVIGGGVVAFGSLAYLGGRRRRRRFEAELEAMK